MKAHNVKLISSLTFCAIIAAIIAMQQDDPAQSRLHDDRTDKASTFQNREAQGSSGKQSYTTSQRPVSASPAGVGLKQLQRELERLRGTVSHQSTELASLRTQLDALQAIVSISGHGQSQSQEIKDESPQWVTQMEETLQSETIDGNWTVQAEETIYHALGGSELSKTLVQDIECRSSLCRMKVTHPGPEAFQTFGANFLDEVSATLPDAYINHVHQDDGTIETVIYLARQSFGLPALE